MTELVRRNKKLDISSSSSSSTGQAALGYSELFLWSDCWTKSESSSSWQNNICAAAFKYLGTYYYLFHQILDFYERFLNIVFLESEFLIQHSKAYFWWRIPLPQSQKKNVLLGNDLKVAWPQNKYCAFKLMALFTLPCWVSCMLLLFLCALRWKDKIALSKNTFSDFQTLLRRWTTTLKILTWNVESRR